MDLMDEISSTNKGLLSDEVNRIKKEINDCVLTGTTPQYDSDDEEKDHIKNFTKLDNKLENNKTDKGEVLGEEKKANISKENGGQVDISMNDTNSKHSNGDANNDHIGESNLNNISMESLESSPSAPNFVVHSRTKIRLTNTLKKDNNTSNGSINSSNGNIGSDSIMEDVNDDTSQIMMSPKQSNPDITLGLSPIPLSKSNNPNKILNITNENNENNENNDNTSIESNHIKLGNIVTPKQIQPLDEGFPILNKSPILEGVSLSTPSATTKSLSPIHHSQNSTNNNNNLTKSHPTSVSKAHPYSKSPAFLNGSYPPPTQSNFTINNNKYNNNISTSSNNIKSSNNISKDNEVNFEDLKHLDSPVYINISTFDNQQQNILEKRSLYYCFYHWGCTETFQRFKDFEEHLKSFCQSYDQFNLRNINIQSSSKHLRQSQSNITASRGVDMIQLGETTDRLIQERYLHGSSPIVIKGLPNNWNIKEFNLDFLRQKYPFNMVMWSVTTNIISNQTNGQNHTQFIGNMNKFSQHFNSHLKNSYSLIMDFPIPTHWETLPFFKNNYLSDQISNFSMSNLYIGFKGSTISLHRNFVDLSLSILKGFIRIILFPPSKMIEMATFNKNIIDKSNKSNRFIYFDNELDAEDLEMISKFNGRVIYLGREDTLIIPSGWYYHCNVLKDETMIINYQMVNQFNLEFFLENYSDPFNKNEFFKSILTRYLEKCNYWIKNQNQYKSQMLSFLQSDNNYTSKKFNSFNVSSINQPLYHQILQGINEGYHILAAFHLLYNNENITCSDPSLIQNIDTTLSGSDQFENVSDPWHSSKENHNTILLEKLTTTISNLNYFLMSISTLKKFDDKR